MPSTTDATVFRDVLRELRKGPVTVAQIAERAGLPWRRVYRTIGKLEAAGAPIVSKRGEWDGRGMPPAEFRLTADGLREWLG